MSEWGNHSGASKKLIVFSQDIFIGTTKKQSTIEKTENKQ